MKRLNFTPQNFVWVSERLKDPSPWNTVYGEEGFCPEKCYISLRFKAFFLTTLLLEFVEIVEKRLKQMKIERLKLFINEKSQRGCKRWALPGLIFFFFSILLVQLWSTWVQTIWKVSLGFLIKTYNFIFHCHSQFNCIVAELHYGSYWSIWGSYHAMKGV